MLCAVVYISSMCLFFVSGDLSYPIFRSATEPEKSKSDDRRVLPPEYFEAANRTNSEAETSEETLNIPSDPSDQEPELIRLEAKGLEPELSEPEGSEPKEFEPERSGPEVPELKVSEPKGSEPKGLELEGSEIKGAEPKGSEPKGLEPETSEPEGSELKGSDPKGAEPKELEPETSEPEGAEPKGAEPKESDVVANLKTLMNERESIVDMKTIRELLQELSEGNKSVDARFRVGISLLNRAWSSAGTTTEKTTTIRETTQTTHSWMWRTQPAETTYYIYHETFSTSRPPLRIATKAVARVRPHKIRDDKKLKKYPEHVYKQALKTFEKMKCDFDEYTREKIDMLAEAYKSIFKEFMKSTSKARIKTGRGIQNAVLHNLETSNLIVKRIVNFMNIEEMYTSQLLHGGAARLRKHVDTHVSREYNYACKAFGVCNSRCSFRQELQHIISTLVIMEDFKLLQLNDAATELLKQNDITIFINSYALELKIFKAIRHQEVTDADKVRSDLTVLYSAISKSHLPLVLNRNAYLASVKRTIKFRCLLDYLDEALPASLNQKAWSDIRCRLERFKDGGPRDIQDSLQMLFVNMKDAMKIYDGAESIRDNLKDLVREALN